MSSPLTQLDDKISFQHSANGTAKSSDTVPGDSVIPTTLPLKDHLQSVPVDGADYSTKSLLSTEKSPMYSEFVAPLTGHYRTKSELGEAVEDHIIYDLVEPSNLSPGMSIITKQDNECFKHTVKVVLCKH